MRLIHTVSELRRTLPTLRPQRLALVPTMGNLHAGHLRLVRRARERADQVAVSIFVNPLQFGPNEDYQRYPRTLDADCAALDAAGADWVFAPAVEEVYPGGVEGSTQVVVPGVSDILCGASRPGHFQGVATVVNRLFNLFQPELAVFGEKDYQQLLVIKTMVRDLMLPIEIVGVATEREADGLALSSRNAYLNPAQRALAPHLYAELKRIAAQLREGRRDYAALEVEAVRNLERVGLRPEYLAVRDPANLQSPATDARAWRILAAAWLGQTRLIDNLAVEDTPDAA